MFSIVEFGELESTNDYLKSLIENQVATDNLLIYTLYQTKGRGQFQRTWHSEPGLDLAFSFYRKVTIDETPFHPALFVMSVCLALLDTFDTFGIKCTVKWPNDLLHGSRKLAGVLLESIVQENKVHIITGIGINLNSQRMSATHLNSISMYDIRAVKTAPYEVLRIFVRSCQKWIKQSAPTTTIEHYNRALYKLQEEVIVYLYNERKGINGRIIGVDSSGRLCLMTHGGLRCLHHGEGSLIRDELPGQQVCQ